MWNGLGGGRAGGTPTQWRERKMDGSDKDDYEYEKGEDEDGAGYGKGTPRRMRRLWRDQT
jgi:hypothetical protein